MQRCASSGARRFKLDNLNVGARAVLVPRMLSAPTSGSGISLLPHHHELRSTHELSLTLLLSNIYFIQKSSSSSAMATAMVCLDIVSISTSLS